MNLKRAVLSLLGVVILTGLPVHSAAQRTTATLYGNVWDSSRAVVPGVAISITNEATGAVFRALSEERGDFTLSFIPPGRYTIQAQLAGFKTFSQTGVVLGAGEQARFPIELAVGDTTQE